MVIVNGLPQIRQAVSQTPSRRGFPCICWRLAYAAPDALAVNGASITIVSHMAASVTFSITP